MNRRPNRRRPDSDSESVHRAGLGRGPTNASWRRGGAAGASPAAPVEPAALSSPPASAATSARDPGARGPRARRRRLIGCGFAPSQSRSDAAAKNSLRGLESAQGGGGCSTPTWKRIWSIITITQAAAPARAKSPTLYVPVFDLHSTDPRLGLNLLETQDGSCGEMSLFMSQSLNIIALSALQYDRTLAP